MTQPTSTNLMPALNKVTLLLDNGVSLAAACQQAAEEFAIRDRPKITGAAFLSRRWLSTHSNPSGSQRSGRRRARFVPSL